MKTVLITGASKGLGRKISIKFAENNYNVIITYLNSKDDALKLKLELESKYHVDVKVFKLDLESDEDIKNLFCKIESLDVLVNNAAYNDDSIWQDKTREEFLKILNINTVGPFLMSKYAYHLLERSHGSIVNISSTNGVNTMYTESLDYDASKAALNNLTKSLSNAFGPNIRVNAVLAGWIDTESTKDMQNSFKHKEQDKILMNRFASPREIANLVFFLASDEASYMTGSIVRIDGGEKYGN